MEKKGNFGEIKYYLTSLTGISSPIVVMTQFMDGEDISVLLNHHPILSYSSFIAGLLGVGMLVNKAWQYVTKRKIEKAQKDPSYNPHQQNLETSVEQYQEPQALDSYQQPQLYNSNSLEDQIAQLRNEIQELESN